ncbi:hypothetical protein BUALT_Bualt04G0096200 [Buddleja alternifolia]|uniref:hAT-like transposase RNase-H fold domain-containing protein n=1 Tax=Buddleja alternifolia TaxID=168488 RepID=A0AAV6XV43_9LAMI|nr:hypothetical protein BUALT_Bualt04G0096200 [Buddleja alternifolia]
MRLKTESLPQRKYGTDGQRIEMSTSYSESSQARESGGNEEIIIESQKMKRKASVVWDHFTKFKGLTQKIRETVRYLNLTPFTTQKFDTSLRQRNLKGKRKFTIDVLNRWNSTHLFLEMVLPMKEASCHLQMIDDNSQFNPSESESIEAKIVHGCLKTFYEVTHHFNGSNYPTSNIFFPDICSIKLKMVEWKISEHDFVKMMCDPMKRMFDRYWDTCCLVLAFAVVFDPRLKLKLVESFYKRIYSAMPNHT